MLHTAERDQFLTLQEAAARLPVSKRTLQLLIRRKEMPGMKIGGQWRIPESHFMKWVDERLMTNTVMHHVDREK